MIENLNFETYLLLSPKKLSINVYEKDNLKNLYFKENLNNNSSNKLDLNLVDQFLKDNIFEIEKILKNFVKNIYLIIESDKFLTVRISVKKNNYGEVIKKENIIHLLYEAKDECKTTIENEKIIHMVIDNYLIDRKNYSLLPRDIKCKFLSTNIRFICLSNTFIKEIEKILKKYQIAINHILELGYVKEFADKIKEDHFKMSAKLINGYNENEILIVPKISKNKGFFQRFFDFFN